MIYDRDEPDEMRLLRFVRNWVLLAIVGLMLLAGAATVVSRAFDLAWFPWDMKMRTGMIRASNSYITTQQQALREFRVSYDDAPTAGQKAAIARQMREIADTVPGNVQPDIAAFLASHSGS